MLGARLLLLAGVEHESRALQIALNCRRHGVRTTEHAPRDSFRVFERRHGLSEIVKRGPVVSVKCLRVGLREQNLRLLSERPSTTRIPFVSNNASKKPSL